MSTTPTVETIDQLREYVGKELGVGSWLGITQDRVNQFADVTGDHQFIHVDPVRAAETPLGGTVAHGFLTLSLLPFLGEGRDGVQVDLHPKMTLNYGLNRVRFVSPVKVGASVRMRTTLQALDEVSAGVYQLTYLQTVEIQGAERPALVAESLIRVYL
ncbi:MAG: MaoC family dehydratase [Chloroflexota bacterium]